MIRYKRSKNLCELIGGRTLRRGKVFKTHRQIINGESKSCNTTNKTSLCCKQKVNTKTFEIYQTNRTFKIFHKLNCRSSFVIYLMECTLCKIQYEGKAVTFFNIRLNNHRKDASGNNPKTIPASRYFKQPGHNFNNRGTLYNYVKHNANFLY